MTRFNTPVHPEPLPPLGGRFALGERPPSFALSPSKGSLCPVLDTGAPHPRR